MISWGLVGVCAQGVIGEQGLGSEEQGSRRLWGTCKAPWIANTARVVAPVDRSCHRSISHDYNHRASLRATARLVRCFILPFQHWPHPSLHTSPSAIVSADSFRSDVSVESPQKHAKYRHLTTTGTSHARRASGVHYGCPQDAKNDRTHLKKFVDGTILCRPLCYCFRPPQTHDICVAVACLCWNCPQLCWRRTRMHGRCCMNSDGSFSMPIHRSRSSTHAHQSAPQLTTEVAKQPARRRSREVPVLPPLQRAPSVQELQPRQQTRIENALSIQNERS